MLKEAHPAYQYLTQLDLSYIKHYMCSEAYTLPQWSAEDAAIAIELYKRFLWLILKYGEEHMIVPTKEIDEVWHNHILHTEKYFKDCEAIANHYIHHRPSDLSMEDKQSLATAFQKTRELYFQEFNEHLPYYQQET